jgi:PKD repeat protein
MPLASGLPRSWAARPALVIPATLKALGHGRIPMKWYRISATALALIGAAGCGGDGGGGPSNANPVAKFSISCTLLDCSFTDASTDADGTVASHNWNFGETGSSTNTSTSASPNHTYAADGAYHVTLTVTDNDGASSAVADSVVNVSSTPPANVPPTAAFTSSCSSLDCTFTDGSTDSDGTIAAWAWDFGDGATDNNQNTTHSYTAAAPDTFAVSLIVTDNAGGKDTVSHNVVVAPPAVCTGASCDLTLQADAHVTITLTSEGCNAVGNTLRITAPVDTTLFTDGCHTPAGTSYDLVGGVANVFASGTTIVPEVISGSSSLAFPPTMRLRAGTGYPTWVLEFDDGEGCGAANPTCGGTEPDFNDLIITITATP